MGLENKSEISPFLATPDLINTEPLTTVYHDRLPTTVYRDRRIRGPFASNHGLSRPEDTWALKISRK